MGISTLIGLLASIIVSLKNSAGNSLIGTTASNIITAGEAVVTSIIADIQASNSSGSTSPTALTAYLQSINNILSALQSEKALSAQTVSLISGLSTALVAAIQAEQAAQTTTAPATLTPIPAAQ
jgi:hypothetical protein